MPAIDAYAGGVKRQRIFPFAGFIASVRPYVVVNTMRPPTKIGEESTVPSSSTRNRCSFETF